MAQPHQELEKFAPWPRRAFSRRASPKSSNLGYDREFLTFCMFIASGTLLALINSQRAEIKYGASHMKNIINLFIALTMISASLPSGASEVRNTTLNFDLNDNAMNTHQRYSVQLTVEHGQIWIEPIERNNGFIRHVPESARASLRRLLSLPKHYSSREKLLVTDKVIEIFKLSGKTWAITDNNNLVEIKFELVDQTTPRAWLTTLAIGGPPLVISFSQMIDGWSHGNATQTITGGLVAVASFFALDIVQTIFGGVGIISKAKSTSGTDLKVEEIVRNHLGFIKDLRLRSGDGVTRSLTTLVQTANCEKPLTFD
jgi:hypothetical protein